MFALPDLRGKTSEEKEALFNKALLVHENRVIFHADELSYKGTLMKASEVNLPFEAMDIFLRNSYKIEDKKIEVVKLLKKDGVLIVSISENIHLKVKVSSLGEIIIEVQDQTDVNTQLKNVVTQDQILNDISSGKAFRDEHFLAPILDVEKHYYNLVYDLLATIDYLNHSETVITTHTTTEKDGKQVKLSKGKIERRIKIKHEYKVYSDNLVRHHKGSKHRYKYRVRGFYRTLADRKEVWVKDHVRGGDGSIFIPKEYEF